MPGVDASPPESPSPPEAPSRWRQKKHRGLLWLAFWVLFFTTPVVPFAAIFLQKYFNFAPLGPLPLIAPAMIAGILGAGFILGTLFSRTTTERIVRSILFALLLAVFFGVIAFVGCVMALRGL